MPKATIENIEPELFPLKSLKDGSVTLRRMSYGQWLTRQELAMNLEIDGGKGKEMGGKMAMANKEVTVFEFKNTIIDHNLENEAGDKLDFRQVATLELLDPRIGNEIAEKISEMHEFLSEEGSGN